jgi:hydroxyacylglutathione hydrolase
MIPFVRSYLVIDDATSTCAAVDPAQPAKALAAAEAAGVAITVVLTTHKHWDHSGGNVELAGAIPGLTVVGGAIDEVDGCTLFVGDGQVLQLGSISVTCLLTPGHTKGHITYFCHHAPSDARHVFTGDVMFVGGCGKFFEGTAAEMHPSLYEKIGTLPDDTLVWPGHEVRVKRKPYTKYSCSNSTCPGSALVRKQLLWIRLLSPCVVLCVRVYLLVHGLEPGVCVARGAGQRRGGCQGAVGGSAARSRALHGAVHSGLRAAAQLVSAL